MKISENTLVSIAYDMYTGEVGDRVWKEKATAEEPMSFLFGAGMMVAGIENKLKGLSIGDKFKFTLYPVDAYGDYNNENVMDLPKSAFEIEGNFKPDVVKKGNMLQMLDSNRKRINCTILEIEEETVTVDFNHQLAGETLHFSGEVIDVRTPTQDEIKWLYEESHCECGDDGNIDCECC